MTTKAQQSALDSALVAPKNQRVIGKCNMRINPGIKPKEPTYQVVMDALDLTTCYLAFLITAEVLVIYMHQLWATVNKHNASYRFKIDNKRFSVNVEVFRDILNICPRVLGQEFNELPSEEEALSFIYELSQSGEIKYITDVSGLDKLRLSRVQILWGMYYKKDLDFVALIWEDLAYQIDNKDSKKQDKMFYPRFTKIIIHHFLEKDKSISTRNRMFMHTARDDSLLGTMRFVSRHKDTQVYGAILPKSMMNQAMLDYVAYKTYYAIASGAEPPKSKKSHKKSDSAISSEESPSKKKPASKPKPTKKKAFVKADRGKGLNVLSEVALFDAAQLKEAKKEAKMTFTSLMQVAQVMELIFSQGFLMSNNAISGTDEGTGAKPGVPDVPKYDSESDKESWGDSGEEDDDVEDDTEDDEGNDGDDEGNDGDDNDGNDDDDDDDSDHKRTESGRDENPNLNQFNEEHEEEEEEENVDEFTDKEDDEENEEESDDGEELYKDVNVNLRKEDVEMTDADQGGADQHNVSQASGFEQEE
ncbi:hypothetical protein Tco_0108696 [Tanacetum coccineum]